MDSHERDSRRPSFEPAHRASLGLCLFWLPGGVVGHAVFACQQRYRVLEHNKNKSCYYQRCRAMKGAFESIFQNRIGAAALAVRTISAKRTREGWPGTFSALDQSLALWLKKSRYFSCCLQGGLFFYSR
jgi:hypothetical protein